ncbi:DegV family protein [Phoenicibacter congonensis]|uniref:DegV family protein n=1 Tax=Phoenicibacter congonensis TaxID=1944646 RepID=UPI0009A7F45A|nr:DegV family protein [Phoenicibacter congonensis]
MIRIMCDSVATSDYSELHDLKVDIVSLSVHYDGVDCLDVNMDFDDFNEHLAERALNLPTSSQPSIASFENYFEDAAKKGDLVVGIFMSSVLSSTIEGAIMAANSVKKRFANFECRLIDSFAACGPQMCAILDAVEIRNEGGSIDEIAEAAKRATLRSRIMFTPDDLRFLVLGGRLNAVTAKVASRLKIFPIITTVDGRADALVKVRTKQKADDKMLDVFTRDVREHGLKHVVIHYAGKKTDELKAFSDRVNQLVGIKVKEVSVSPVISVHAGPAIGIAYQCEEEIAGRFTKPNPQIIYAI